MATTLLSALVAVIIPTLATLIVPLATRSLTFLLVVIGGTLILWVGINLVVNLLSTTIFAPILFHLYHSLSDPGQLNLAEGAASMATAETARLRLTKGRLLAGALVGIVAALVVGIVAVKTVRLEDDTEITAHRGASASAPENTLAAVRQAIEDKADWVEIDVQETADGQVVVFHDSDFKKLAGLDLKIWNATMADLEDDRYRQPLRTAIQRSACSPPGRSARHVQGQDPAQHRAQILWPR